MQGTVLVVDDEQDLARSLVTLLIHEGYQASMAQNATEARQEMKRLYPDVVLMDRKLPDGDGIEVIAQLKEEFPQSLYIVITAHGSIRSAVESTRRGAVNYLVKPFEPEEMFLAIQQALHEQRLTEEVRCLRASHEGREKVGGRKISGSRAMREVYTLAQHAAQQEGIVLLLGESGTGKDYMARWIHQHSPRAEGPFFSINCAALTRDLAESELFGHEPGAFSGARGRKRGLLELAEGGTLLLNEVGELDLSLQSKLLTFLDTRSFLRVGGEQSISVDARIIAATNRELSRDLEEGTFRQDLYYRLNVFPLRLPPLRERSEDIPDLIEDLLERLTHELSLTPRPKVEVEALESLSSYSWPGNVRELRNILERALMISPDHRIRRDNLRWSPTNGEWKLEISFPQGESLFDVTKKVARQLILEALQRARTRQEAAELLGISRYSLARQIKSLGIHV